MSNKVVQLIDNSSNNLYPLAGGMAASSITTAMIQDGAVTLAKTSISPEVIGATESYTIASTDWASLASSSPFTYSTTVVATYQIGADTIVHLMNDQAVAFANYGFAVSSVSGQNVTIYSIGAPDSSVTLKINYKEVA